MELKSNSYNGHLEGHIVIDLKEIKNQVMESIKQDLIPHLIKEVSDEFNTQFKYEWLKKDLKERIVNKLVDDFRWGPEGSGLKPEILTEVVKSLSGEEFKNNLRYLF